MKSINFVARLIGRQGRVMGYLPDKVGRGDRVMLTYFLNMLNVSKKSIVSITKPVFIMFEHVIYSFHLDFVIQPTGYSETPKPKSPRSAPPRRFLWTRS